MVAEKRYMTAEEAAAALEISRATLYAYVSRGLIRSEPAGAGTRAHRYYREDIERLHARQKQRRNPAAAAQQAAAAALHFGTPVLASGLTLIAQGHLYYRGRDVLELAQEQTLEQVATLLWTGETREVLFSSVGALPEAVQALRPHLARLAPLERLQMVLPTSAAADAAAYDRRPRVLAQTGARILSLLVAVAAGEEAVGSGFVATLQRGWGVGGDKAARLLNAALVLCADHELNVSSFTARCVASAGSTLYGVVLAGLAALQGTRHGGHTARVAALLREVEAPQQARDVLAGRLRRGENIPGFGHRLYPKGDPRGRLLLQLAAEVNAEHPALTLAMAVVGAAHGLIGEFPTVDFGLVTAVSVLGLAAAEALTLFALGRTAGWIAHAIEQIEDGRLIRPRARYVGPLPS